MADVFTKAKRSNVMSRIRSRGNLATELKMIAIFRSHGITGWRRNKPVFGRPDFVFPLERVAVFVDGSFWHGCPQHYSLPGNNAEIWRRKWGGESGSGSARESDAAAGGVECRLRVGTCAAR